MDLGLRDRVYLVTGGSRGLGFAAAQALVADGARVLLSSPHEATASSAAARLAPDAAADVAAWIVADNADPATPGRLIAAARDRFGRLDGALISVGGSPPGTVAATTDEAWRSAFPPPLLLPPTHPFPPNPHSPSPSAQPPPSPANWAGRGPDQRATARQDRYRPGP